MPVLSCGGHGGRLPCQGSRPLSCRAAPPCRTAPRLCGTPCRLTPRPAVPPAAPRPPAAPPAAPSAAPPAAPPAAPSRRTLSPLSARKAPAPACLSRKKRPPAACRRAPAHPGGRRPIPAGEVPPSRCLRAIHAPHTVVGPNHKKKRRRRRPQFPPVFPRFKGGRGRDCGGRLAALGFLLRRMVFLQCSLGLFHRAGQSRRGR